MDNCNHETVIKTEVNDQPEVQVTFENSCQTTLSPKKSIDRNTYNVGEMIVKVEKDLINGYCFESVIEFEKNGILDNQFMTNNDLDKMQPFVCDICHQTMTTKKKMARHIAQSHSELSTQKNSGKQSVKNTFSDGEMIVKVEKDLINGYCFESVIEIEKNGLLERKLTNNDLDKMQPFVCDICHQTMTTKKKIARHIAKSHSVHSSTQKISRKQSVKNTISSTKHKRIHTVKKPYKCDVCLKCFSQKFYLGRHQRVHTGEKPYKCNLCSKSFALRYNLTIHERVHTGEKLYICDVCSKSFTFSSNLKTHKRLHTGKKEYKCDVCLKCFSQKNALQQHERMHTGVKPYKCDVCKKSFSGSSFLTEHKRVHTGEKPYICNVCSKSFTFSTNLKTHKQLLHTGKKTYQCDICLKRFSQKASARIHERVHTGEKPYDCDLCSKSFSYSSNLRAHQRLHTGNKPYKCDICSKSFPNKYSLTRHKRRKSHTSVV